MIHSSQSEDHSVRIVCNELTDLENYTQPNAPGMIRSVPAVKFLSYAPVLNSLCSRELYFDQTFEILSFVKP